MRAAEEAVEMQLAMLYAVQKQKVCGSAKADTLVYAVCTFEKPAYSPFK